jgi:hypothetical protein
MGGGQGGQDGHHQQHGHPAQLRTPARGQVRGRLVAPAGRPRPHRGHPQATRPRWPRRAGRRRPWAAAWCRACSAWAWAAVVRHRLRQRQRRQRAWCGSEPRPRSSTRNGTVVPAPARPPHASEGRRSATVACQLTLQHHRSGPGRVWRGGGAGGPGRPPAAARPRPSPGGAAGGPLGRRPAGRTGNRTTAGRCGASRTQPQLEPDHSGDNA